jgi:hypothetical protein
MKGNPVYLSLALLAVMTLGITACGTSTTVKETASVSSPTTTTPTASAPARPTPPAGGAFTDNRTAPSLDFTSAAAKLGISEEQLREAFNNSGQGMPDLTKAAETLGITEEALREALGFPEGGQGVPGGGPGPGGTPPTDLPAPTSTSNATTS